MASAPFVAAIVAAWLSIAGHGLVDSFLTFTPTYVLFGLTAGLTFAAGLTNQAVSREPQAVSLDIRDAHRL